MSAQCDLKGLFLNLPYDYVEEPSDLQNTLWWRFPFAIPSVIHFLRGICVIPNEIMSMAGSNCCGFRGDTVCWTGVQNKGCEVRMIAFYFQYFYC